MKPLPRFPGPRLTTRTALWLGLLLWSVGLILWVLHPFGRSDLQDMILGVVIGLGIGMQIMALIKRGKRPRS
jgi:hypothetical protein